MVYRLKSRDEKGKKKFKGTKLLLIWVRRWKRHKKQRSQRPPDQQ